jgi:hypothetical protein
VTVVFKDLQKLVSAQQHETTRKELFQRLQDKPFWIWDKQQHKQQDINTNGECCFNHIIGLPQKDGIDKPVFDYERIIYDTLITPNGGANYKHVWIKKATTANLTYFLSAHSIRI